MSASIHERERGECKLFHQSEMRMLTEVLSFHFPVLTNLHRPRTLSSHHRCLNFTSVLLDLPSPLSLRRALLHFKSPNSQMEAFHKVMLSKAVGPKCVLKWYRDMPHGWCAARADVSPVSLNLTPPSVVPFARVFRNV